MCKRQFKSKYQEYMAADWRRHSNNINITAETVVPSVPKPLLVEPDDAAYHNGQIAKDEKIEELQAEFNDLTVRYGERLNQLRSGQQGKGGVSKELRGHFDALKEWQDKKREIFAAREKIDKQINEINRERDKLAKRCHQVYNTIDQLEKGVKQLEKRLTTNTLSAADEKLLIQEIEKVKNSKPHLEKREQLRAQIDQLREEQKQASTGLPEINKMLAGIRKQIDGVKSKEQVFVLDKAEHQSELDRISAQKKYLMGRVAELRASKNEAKEDFYGKLVEYEIQQRLLKDIDWLTKTKEAQRERAVRREAQRQEYLARVEARAKLQAEREKRQEQRRQQEEQRKEELAAKQAAWEAQQLKRLDVHPYQAEIDLCEHLIYYCARTRKDLKQTAEGPSEGAAASTTQQQQRKIEEQLAAGKLQDVERVVESDATRQKPGKKKREGPSQFYYEDDSRLNLDYVLVKKFSKLGLSPPIDHEQLPATQTQLQQLRDGLKVKGELEKREAKAKLLKDESWVEGGEHAQLKKDMEALSEQVRKCVDTIRRDKLNWDMEDEGGDSDGVNINEDIDEEEVGRRFTKLRPDRKPKPAQPDPAKAKPKFNADSAEAFPSF